MNVRISKKLLMEAGLWKKDSERDERFRSYTRYILDDEKFTLDIRVLTQKELKALLKATDDKPEWRGLNGKIATYFRIAVDPEGVTLVYLERLEPAIKNYLQKTPNHWLFCESDDGMMLPYYVEEVQFLKATRRHGEVHPAHVNMTLASSSGSRSVSFWKEDLQGQNVAQLLEKSGWYVENKDLLTKYNDEMKLFHAEKRNTGEQFRAVGVGYTKGSTWWRSSSLVAMERDGRASKVVMDCGYVKAESNKDTDDDEGESSSVKSASTEYWLTQEEKMKREKILATQTDESEAEAEKLIPLEVASPLHPYVNVFDLKEHDFVRIHVGNLQKYSYDETVNDKLVLPKAKKDLVGLLVQGANFLMEDIIEGKTGGIIVLATGIPGTGKTLTAEVYAETIKKPLYTVQCSQLGTSPNEIESTLGVILKRATRWGAILLIDEADVYVRERGTDIEQNAIVGVFLRVLEYYRGVLFMTSNRATILDDAVLSRATAHIVYEPPNETERARIWEVLSKQFGLKLIGGYSAFAQEFPNVTGRTIKNLLKLSMLLGKKEKRPIDVRLVRDAAEFIDGAGGASKSIKVLKA